MLGDVAASCETVLRTARWTRWGNVTNGAIRGVTQRGWLRSTRIEICFTPWSAGVSELSVGYDLPWPAIVQLRQHDYDRLHNLADAIVAGLQLGTLDSSESLGWSDADDIDMRELVSA